MAVRAIRRISSWTLLAAVLVSVVVFFLFYTGGVEDKSAEFKAPVHTSTLLYWTYIITLITVAALVVFAIWQFALSLKDKPKSALGSLGVLVIFAALMGIAYALGDGTPLAVINADSASYNTPFWLKVTDMWLYAMYILLALCIIAIAVISVFKIIKK